MTFAVGVIGGGVAVQMAREALADYGSVAISFLSDTIVTYPEFTFFKSADELLQPHLIQAAYIATPVDSHLRILEHALRAGLPVLLEKPLACNLDDVHAFGASHDTSRVALAFRKRFSDIGLAIRASRIELPAEPCQVDVRWLAPHPGIGHWKAGPRDNGGGVVLDIGSHIFDLLDHCIGKIGRLSVTEYQPRTKASTPDYVCLFVEFDDDSTANIQLGWAKDLAVQSIEFRQSDRQLRWHKDSRASRSTLSENIGPLQRERNCSRQDEYRRMLAQFRRFIQGEETTLATWHDGVRNMERITAVESQLM